MDCSSLSRDYVTVETQGYRGYVRKDYSDELLGMLIQNAAGKFLGLRIPAGNALQPESASPKGGHGLGATPPGAAVHLELIPRLSAGRGEVRHVQYSGGTAVLRQGLRGGMMRWLRDRYLFYPRMLSEFVALLLARERGLPVPQPLGVLWRRRGIICRGWLATAWIEGEDLDVCLGTAREHDATLRQCGAVIRQMHDAGLYHADLQVKNIRISPEGPILMDFDGAKFRKQLSMLARARNLLRFRRSLEKNGLSLHYFRPLCEGYGEVRLPSWLQLLYTVKGRVSDQLSGRKSIHD